MKTVFRETRSIQLSEYEVESSQAIYLVNVCRHRISTQTRVVPKRYDSSCGGDDWIPGKHKRLLTPQVQASLCACLIYAMSLLLMTLVGILRRENYLDFMNQLRASMYLCLHFALILTLPGSASPVV